MVKFQEIPVFCITIQRPHLSIGKQNLLFRESQFLNINILVILLLKLEQLNNVLQIYDLPIKLL